VRELLGARVTDVVAEKRRLPVGRLHDGAEFRDFFKRTYGPTIAVYRSLADDPERAAELDAALEALGDEASRESAMEWEYLLLTARRA
jgi:hypothetical protein